MSLKRCLPLAALAFGSCLLATPLKLDYEGGPTNVPLPGGGNRIISHKHVASVPYKVGKANWEVSLDPDPPVYTAGAGDAYLGILKNDFPEKDGWSYKQAGKELPDNSLIVHHYEAFAVNGVVGAIFEMVVANTPADLHWILVATSNHKLGEKHGTAESEVITGGVSPYFDEKYTSEASPQFFSYKSSREWENPHAWKGQLLLVTGPAVGKFGVTPGPVTVYGAVEFGWKNYCTDGQKPPPPMGSSAAEPVCTVCECSTGQAPEPATAGLLALGLIPLFWRMSRRRFSALAVSAAIALTVGIAGPITTGYDGGPSKFTSVTWPNGGGKKLVKPNTIGHGFKASEQYDIPVTGGTSKWETRLKPLVKIGDKQGPEYVGATDATFLDALKNEFSAADGWSFTLANQALGDDSLIVHDYIAHGTPRLVGAEFMVEYKPTGAPPNNLHWIQVIKNNHKDGGQHGAEEYKVDRGPGLSPYYDEIGISGFNDLTNPTSFFFYDFPRRSDGNMAHTWTAELYLVTGPERTRYGITPGPINILGGIRWGWENSCVAAAPKRQLSETSAVFGDAESCSFTPNPPVPEPSTALLALSAGLILISRAASRRYSKARQDSI